MTATNSAHARSVAWHQAEALFSGAHSLSVGLPPSTATPATSLPPHALLGSALDASAIRQTTTPPELERAPEHRPPSLLTHAEAPSNSSATPARHQVGHQTRNPRVHRLPAAATTSVPLEAPSDVAPSSQPLRRQRRRLNGQVSIIRPIVPELLPSPSVSVPTNSSVAPAGAPEALSLPRSAPTPAVSTPHSFVDPDLLRSYVALQKQIKRLEVLARKARKREAAAAIAWIRKVVALLGLTPRDLGL